MAAFLGAEQTTLFEIHKYVAQSVKFETMNPSPKENPNEKMLLEPPALHRRKNGGGPLPCPTAARINPNYGKRGSSHEGDRLGITNAGEPTRTRVVMGKMGEGTLGIGIVVERGVR